MNNHKESRNVLLALIRENNVKGIIKFLTNPYSNKSYFVNIISNRDIYDFLSAAIELNNLQTLKLLIDNLPEIDCNQTSDEPILIKALYKGNKEMVELLLKHGAHFGSYFQSASTHQFCLKPKRPGLLYSAAKVGTILILDYLLAQGINVNSKEPVKNDTSLHASVSDVVVANFLLNRGADVNAMNCNQETPLHYAVDQNNLKSVELLIGHGATVTCLTKECFTPLHFAVTNNCSAIAEYLLNRGANALVRDINGSTPLHLAISLGSTEMVKLLLKHKSNVEINYDNGIRPFDLAASLENQEIVKLLLDAGAHVKVKIEKTTDVLENKDTVTDKPGVIEKRGLLVKMESYYGALFCKLPSSVAKMILTYLTIEELKMLVGIFEPLHK